MHVHSCQQWSVGYSESAPRLAHEPELKSQISIDVFFPTSKGFGLDPSSNCLNGLETTQLSPPSSTKLLLGGTTIE